MYCKALKKYRFDVTEIAIWKFHNYIFHSKYYSFSTSDAYFRLFMSTYILRGNFALVNTLFFLVLPHSTLTCLFHPHVLKLGLKVQFLGDAPRSGASATTTAFFAQKRLGMTRETREKKRWRIKKLLLCFKPILNLVSLIEEKGREYRK